jgi:hypothetical protein
MKQYLHPSAGVLRQNGDISVQLKASYLPSFNVPFVPHAVDAGLFVI